MNVFQNDAEALAEFLLTKVRQWAMAARTGAVVVRVFSLLDFCRYGAIVVCAFEQTCKRKLMLAVFRFVEASENVLNPLKKLVANQWRVRAFVKAFPPSRTTR